MQGFESTQDIALPISHTKPPGAVSSEIPITMIFLARIAYRRTHAYIRLEVLSER